MTFTSKKGRNLKVIFLILILFLPPLLAAAQSFNYAEALQKGIWFYEAQQSGPLPAWNRVQWRADSCLEDGFDVGVDLTGGWFDAGDHVKFGFPMAASVTTIAWGASEYREGYENSGQLTHLLNNLRFVNDYFLKAHIVSDGATSRFYGHVGSGSTDHSYWGSPEVMFLQRPAYAISPSAPGSELAAETAAALAASSLVFRPTDPAYADTLLSNAEILYTFADTYRGEYDQSISDANAFYHSYNGYIDDLAWGAIWLYYANEGLDAGKSASYLATAEARYADYLALVGSTPEHREYAWTHNWNDKYFASSVLLAKITGAAVYREKAEMNLNWWTTGHNGERITYTPGGLAWLADWGPTRYAANAALLAFVYGDWTTDATLKQRYLSFAREQINYILGDNPLNMSYLVGFGSQWPLNPHHRAAHGSWVADIRDPDISRHTLYGALIGGPDASDAYSDDRSNYQQSEVACDYNAGLLGALSRMAMEYGSNSADPSFPQPETRDLPELSIEAKSNAGGGWGFQPMIRVVNKTAWPPRITSNLSARYFFTIESGKNPADFSIMLNGGDGVIAVSGPHQWSGNIYYALIDLTGLDIYPGGYSAYYEDVYVTINDATNTFDKSDDWSATGVTSAETLTEYITLYEGGQLVWGNEPGGGDNTPTPTPVVTPPPTPTTGVARGDVNGDRIVNIVDALMIAQYYVGLDVPGFILEAADFSSDGTVNIVDALMVAQCYVGLISCS